MVNKRKRTATITFHASHNYGSILQAYGLQQTLLSLGVDNEIINLRMENQKKFYFNPAELKIFGWRRRLRFLLIDFFIGGYSKALAKKFNLFESFLRDKLKLTSEFSTGEELKSRLPEYDYYVTGSDQCWNPTCLDFDMSYYLDFTESKNKISFASSFGPKAPSAVIEPIAEAIKKFKAVSAREIGSADYINRITGVEAGIMPDPTLLISREQWNQLAGDTPLIDLPYIFVYTPFPRVGTIEAALKLSDLTGLQLVISNEMVIGDMKKLMKRKNVRFKMDVGPIEFLNLIKNAKYVVSGSFHAIVFSIIFQVPFLAINGNRDNRMKEMLEKCSCIDNAIEIDSNGVFTLDKLPGSVPDEVDAVISAERDKAINYLKAALDIEK